MFPPSLQKNIQELDRQISLLETECENIESEKKEFATQSKINSKVSIRESGNKPFITGPICNSSSFTKKVISPVVPMIYSTGSVPQKTMSRKVSCLSDKIRIENDAKHEEEKAPRESKTLSRDATAKSSQKEKENKKSFGKKSFSSITEVSESSDEVFQILTKEKINFDKKSSKGQTWSHIFGQQVSSKTKDVPNKIVNEDQANKSPRRESGKLLQADENSSSGEELSKDLSCNETDETIPNERQKYENNRLSSSYDRMSAKKRRRRSTRTRKNSVDEIPVDVNMTKVLNEKEIQCKLWNEEREKTEFLVNLHESIRTLHLLISDLKMKSSQDKQSEVLNNMQNTLLKITGIKSINTLNDPLNMFTCIRGGRVKFLEGEETNERQIKKAFLDVKKFCEELTDEKSALTDELNVKAKTIANMKSKEKEYLSLISNLKFNLEKIKKDADEEAKTKKALLIVKNKLKEESKVAEALKKSHEKMQELIQNYVMENDQLRTQLKITQLETQKYDVLLASRDEEIKKYKEEIESFQKQISQQLNLLRSKASAGNALDILSNHTKILNQTDSNYSETTLDKKECDHSDSISSKTSIESIWINEKDTEKEISISSEMVLPNEIQQKSKTEVEKRVTENLSAICNSEESFEENEEPFKILNKAEILRNSMGEILQKMKAQSSQSSFDVSQCTLISTSSENLSEEGQQV